MGRFLMYATIAVLAVFVLSSFTLLKHGNEGLGQVKTYAAHDLPLNRAYDGAAITVDGTLVYNSDLNIYSLTDETTAEPTRVAGLSHEELDPFVGEGVRINGTYVHSDIDPHIEAKAIRPMEPSTTSSSPAES